MRNPETEKRNYHAFIWHSIFLSITITFTEVNTVIPAMILQIGGSEIHVGLVGAIMIGVPLLAQLNFTGFLHGKRRKKPWLLMGINMRVLSLGAIALTLMQVHRMTVMQALLVIYLELLLFTVSGAFAGVSYVDLIGKSFSTEIRRRFFTRKQLISSVGILVSALLARQVLSTFAYPRNYIMLFAAAAVVLLIATGGFWRIREEPGKGAPGSGYLRTLASIPGVLKADRNLRIYLLYRNSVGFHVALLPFYVAYARQHYQLDPALAGNLLFFQIAGMVSASLLWPRLVKSGGFKAVLRVWSILSFLLPPAALLIGTFLPLPVYLLLFLFTGAVVSARLVSQDAVIVELSTEENRVLYTGISGTLNLTVVFFPVIIGTIITFAGYVPVFIGVSLFAVVSLLFLHRLGCPADVQES
jgi:MFS family permease